MKKSQTSIKVSDSSSSSSSSSSDSDSDHNEGAEKPNKHTLPKLSPEEKAKLKF